MFAWYASFEGDSSVFFFIHRSITPARERERKKERKSRGKGVFLVEASRVLADL